MDEFFVCQQGTQPIVYMERKRCFYRQGETFCGKWERRAKISKRKNLDVGHEKQ